MAETTALPALLPCPFCGGPARLVESKAAPDGLERHSVECGPNSDNGSCPVEPSTEWRPTAHDAAVLWNTRAAASSISPESPEGSAGDVDGLPMRRPTDAEIEQIRARGWEISRIPFRHGNSAPPAPSEALQGAGELGAGCPDGLLPDGEVCPRCNQPRAPSGVGGGTWVHFPRTSPGPATQGDARVRACAGCLPEYGDCLNAGCFLMLGTLSGGDVVEMGDAQPGCGPLWTSPDAPLSRRVEVILSRLLSDVIEPRDAIAEIVRLAAPRAAVTDAQRVENGRARRWTCPEEAAIRQLVASALSLSVDDVTEDVSEMLHRLVYRRERPSRVLASVEGEVHVFEADTVFRACAYMRLRDSEATAASWINREAQRLTQAGVLPPHTPVRVVIVADDPWTRESAASFAGVLDPESLDNTAPPSPMASECDRWGCDGDHKYFSHDPQTGELTPWKEA